MYLTVFLYHASQIGKSVSLFYLASAYFHSYVCFLPVLTALTLLSSTGLSACSNSCFLFASGLIVFQVLLHRHPIS
jgi:hypothetical protein